MLEEQTLRGQQQKNSAEHLITRVTHYTPSSCDQLSVKWEASVWLICSGMMFSRQTESETCLLFDSCCGWQRKTGSETQGGDTNASAYTFIYSSFPRGLGLTVESVESKKGTNAAANQLWCDNLRDNYTECLHHCCCVGDCFVLSWEIIAQNIRCFSIFKHVLYTQHQNGRSIYRLKLEFVCLSVSAETSQSKAPPPCQLSSQSKQVKDKVSSQSRQVNVQSYVCWQQVKVSC